MRVPFAAWIERDVVRASGPDTAGFLQGQLSQDVDALAIGASTWSLLLQPSGKVDAWLRVTREADNEFVLDVDGGWGDKLIERLARFKLRTKCDLDRVDGWRCIAVRDSALRDPVDEGVRPIVWPGTEGYDLLGPDVDPPGGLELAAGDAYERRRSKPVCLPSGTS